MPTAGRFGTATRNSLRGPEFFNLDLGIMKKTAVTEQVTVELGDYLRIRFACKPSDQGLRITLSAFEGTYARWWKKLQLEVFGLEKEPREVRVGSKLLTDWLQFDAQGQLMLEIPDTPEADEIRILY